MARDDKARKNLTQLLGRIEAIRGELLTIPQ
jgi:hypothetical protein